jgi:predicted PurR-regulated permease PerM
MNYGDGIAGMFIALMQLIETFATTLLLGFAVIYFFWLIAKFMWTVRQGGDTKPIKQQIPWAIVLLTVMFTVYGLIALTANIFGLAEGGGEALYFK